MKRLFLLPLLLAGGLCLAQDYSYKYIATSKQDCRIDENNNLVKYNYQKCYITTTVKEIYAAATVGRITIGDDIYQLNSKKEGRNGGQLYQATGPGGIQYSIMFFMTLSPSGGINFYEIYLFQSESLYGKYYLCDFSTHR